MEFDFYRLERQHARKGQRVAGADEAGRGPLAGPVVAAACILPADCFLEGVNDSKKLTAKKRDMLYEQIMQNEHMLRYNDAKNDFDALLQRITGIIGLCADGEDPETCDYDAASCGGNCSSCAGCH